MARTFTREEIDELARQLSVLAVKDTEFEKTDELHSDDLVAIVQGGVNKTVSADAFTRSLTEDVKQYVDERFDECNDLVNVLTKEVGEVKDTTGKMQQQIGTALDCINWKDI